MAKTVVALFDHYADAQSAANALESAGFTHDHISILANEAGTTMYGTNPDHATTMGDRMGHFVHDTAGGVVEGGLIGGATGLAAGLAMLLIPGVGPVLALGPLAAMFTGATIGAMGGGIIGALTGIGVPKDQAHFYAEGVRRGGTLVTVRTDDGQADNARDILNRYQPVDIEERGAYYRNAGYTEFNNDAQPYTAEELSQYRATNTTQYRPTPSYTTAQNMTDDQTASTLNTANLPPAPALTNGYRGARVHDYNG